MTAFPKNTDEVYRYAFCADAPPLLQVPHRPGLRAFPCGKTQRPPGSCSYWHWGASKLQWRSANTWRLPCLAPRTETQTHACPLPSICVPHSPVGVSSPGACLTGRRLPNRKFRQPSCIATMREIHFSIIIPHPLFNLYHFWIYVNDFLSDFLHSQIESIFFNPYEYSIKATIFI